jgi:hypothetical protein
MRRHLGLLFLLRYFERGDCSGELVLGVRLDITRDDRTALSVDGHGGLSLGNRIGAPYEEQLTKPQIIELRLLRRNSSASFRMNCEIVMQIGKDSEGTWKNFQRSASF